MYRRQQFEAYAVSVTEVVEIEEKHFEGPNALMNQQPSAFEHGVPQIMSEFVWKKNEYALEHSHQPEDTRRVMIIYSGGTLGMKWSDENGEYGGGSACGMRVLRRSATSNKPCHLHTGYQPVPHYLESKIKTYPMFHDASYDIAEEETNYFEPFEPLALP